jgi:HPr kinase/phosphorylase
MRAAGERLGIHATAAIFGEWGVLILGASGAGKSALALALMARARDSGRYGALIGDDRIWLKAEHGRLVARGAALTAGQIEQRPAGLVTAPAEPAAIVHLAVELEEGPPRFPHAPDLWQNDGIATLRLALDRNRSAADNALAVEERLGLMFPMGCGKTNFA